MLERNRVFSRKFENTFFSLGAGVEYRAFHRLGKCSIDKLHPQTKNNI
jgi:hypothetical protein